MSDQTITSLIEKLEGAEAGSRELDADVAEAVGDCAHRETEYYYIQGDSGFDCKACGKDPHRPGIAHFTTSLDAALALAGRVLGKGWGFYLRRDGDGSGCGLIPPGMTSVTPGHMEAATPALALCAAILRAQSEARV